jgi:hypothetical protein
MLAGIARKVGSDEASAGQWWRILNTVAIVLLAAPLAAAGALKLLAPSRSASLVAELWARGGPTRHAVTSIPYLELSLAACLVAPVLRRGAAVASLGLLLGFSVVVLTKGRPSEAKGCGCFGSVEDTLPRWWALVRNAALMALAVVVAAGGESPVPTGVLALLVLCVAGFVVSLLLALELRQRDSASSTLAPARRASPPLDERLVTTDGASTTIRRWLATGRPHVLVFVDPICGPCRSLLPAVADHQRASGPLAIGVVSRGPVTENMAMARDFGLAPVAVDPADTLSRAFGVSGTPAAVLLSESGDLLAGPVLGRSGTLSLFDSSPLPLGNNSPGSGASRT